MALPNSFPTFKTNGYVGTRSPYAPLPPNKGFPQFQGLKPMDYSRTFELTSLVYPADLRSTKNRPVIRFKMLNGRKMDKNPWILFPIPAGLDFSEGASYDDAALGTFGSSILAGAQSAQNEFASSGNMMNAAKAGGAGALANASGGVDGVSLFNRVMGSIGSQFAPEAVKSAMSIGMAVTLNKNIVTEFSGVGTRNFSFKFKMYATSKTETDTIKQIIHAFRLGCYPEGNSFALKYPPKWAIQFLDSTTGVDIPYIPKIAACYLTGVNTQFNDTAAVWHNDGSPVDCTITLAFKEVRALTAEDIQLLDGPSWVPLDKLVSSEDIAKMTDDVEKSAKAFADDAAAKAKLATEPGKQNGKNRT